MIKQMCPPEARTSGGNVKYLDQLRELARKKYMDNERDLYLEQRGITTIRYKNEQILKDIKNVYKDLEIKLKQRETELTSVLPCQREN